MKPTARRISLLGLSLALTACSVLESDKIDYKSAQKGPTLEVPPDLTQLTRNTRYAVPGGAVSANALQAGQQEFTTRAPEAASLNQVGDVRIVRNGQQRWLVVNRPAEALWEPIREFWSENGFVLVQDQQRVGIMETDWAENRAKIPQDFIRNTLGKVLDSLYSTGERDKFRTRLERSDNGTTEIYISHRGMIEVFNAPQQESTAWQPRPADPELEAEFLRRLMIKLGMTAEQAKAVMEAPVVQAPVSRIAQVNGQPAVALDEPFDRAWRRTGLALDRTGFTVEDRNRNAGTYFVRYVPPDAKKEDKRSWLGRVFNTSAPAIPPVKYQIAVRSEGERSFVTVLNEQGQPDNTANAQRIIELLAQELK